MFLYRAMDVVGGRGSYIAETSGFDFPSPDLMINRMNFDDGQRRSEPMLCILCFLSVMTASEIFEFSIKCLTELCK